jgi:hypothetical protein
MKGQSGLDNYYLNLGSTVGQLGIRCIADLYRMNSRDEYQQSVPRTHNMNFDSYFMEVNRQFSLNEKWKIIARLQYKNQEPWALKQTVDSASLSAGVGRFNILSERYTESLNSSYDISNQLNISAGAQYFTDVSTNQISDQVFHKTNSQKFKYSNSSCFVQSMWKSKWFNLIAGLRYFTMVLSDRRALKILILLITFNPKKPMSLKLKPVICFQKIRA